MPKGVPEVPIRQVGKKRRRQFPDSINGTYKLTPAVSDSICDILRIGGTLEQAAAVNMITPNTVINWVNDGIEGKSPELREFAMKIDQAKAMFFTDNLKNISEAGKTKSWICSAWLLERVPQGQPFAIQKQRLEVQDVTVKDAAINSAESAALAAKTLELVDQADIVDVEVENS